MLASVLLALAVPQQTSGGDDFDRPDANALGPGWVEHAGSIGILRNQAHGQAPWSLAKIANVSAYYGDAWVEARFARRRSGPAYVALSAGYATALNNIFVKVHDTDFDQLYDRVYFYYGNNGLNGGSTAHWGASQWSYPLATPTPSGRMVLRFDQSGDRAVLTVENDASGRAEVFHADSLSNISRDLGKGFGLGTYGEALVDDYFVDGDGSALRVALSAWVAGAPTTVTTHGADPGDLVIVGYSLTGGGPTSTIYGDVALSPPIEQLPARVADAAGETRAQYLVPASLAGRDFWVQALALGPSGASELSRPWAKTFR